MHVVIMQVSHLRAGPQYISRVCEINPLQPHFNTHKYIMYNRVYLLWINTNMRP